MLAWLVRLLFGERPRVATWPRGNVGYQPSFAAPENPRPPQGGSGLVEIRPGLFVTADGSKSIFAPRPPLTSAPGSDPISIPVMGPGKDSTR